MGDEKFLYLDLGTSVPIQNENAVSLLAKGSGGCLEVWNHTIFGKAIEN